MTLKGTPPGAGQTWTQYLDANKAKVQAALASECNVPAQFVTELNFEPDITGGTTTTFHVDMAQPVELLQDT